MDLSQVRQNETQRRMGLPQGVFPYLKCLLQNAFGFLDAAKFQIQCTQALQGGGSGRVPSLEFCILCQRFRPFYKGLEDFSGVRIQSGVAESPLLPGRVT